MRGVAFIVGLRQEARLLAGLGCAVHVGGGTPHGATRAAQRAVSGGAEALVSFGLAGGLDSALAAGDVVRPDVVLWNGRRYSSDVRVNAALGGSTGGALLSWGEAAASVAHKSVLRRSSGAVAIDLESGPVAEVAARGGLPFAVLRAICDPASRDLPPAAMAALDARGRIRLGAVSVQILRQPKQLGALLALAQDAAAARRALQSEVARIMRDQRLSSSV